MQTIKILTIKGMASNREIANITIDDKELSITLLELLAKHAIPVASSCKGDGVCRKCIATTNEDEVILTCQKKVNEYFGFCTHKTLTFSYL